MPNVPVYECDFYDDAFIRDPHPHYRRMRALGPVVYIPQLDNYALTGHAAVRSALRDHATFCSGRGVAGDAFGCDFLQGNTVASDEPRHSQLRSAMAPPLLPGTLGEIEPAIRAASEDLIDDLAGRESFDAIADLARHLPLTIVRDMVGLPGDGPEKMLAWAGAAFDILGVQNQRGRDALRQVEAMRQFITEQFSQDSFRPASWTRRIVDLAKDGLVADDLVPFAIRDYINPSLDTTISATGELIRQLSLNPDQWRRLRQEPQLCTNAVNEAVRLGSPIRSFSRQTVQDVTIGDVTIPSGKRVMMLFASANRDETAFPSPDAFDLDREPHHHVGFGSGIHMCIGMHLAELEMGSLLRAMIPRVEEIETGEPDIALNNTIRAYARLPARFGKATRTVQVPSGAPRISRETHQQLDVIVSEREDIADDIVCFTLTLAGKGVLPAAEPGAHIDVFIRPGLVRQYSLTGKLGPDCYRIAVQKERDSRGGSVAMVDGLAAHSALSIGAPRNNFPLIDDGNRVMLFAGGIGLTPLYAMAWQLFEKGRDFEFHVAARTRARVPFARELLSAPFADRVTLHIDAETKAQPINVAGLIARQPSNTSVYVCGPGGYMTHVLETARRAGIPEENLHKEHFSAEIDTDGNAFDVTAAKSGKTVRVHPGETILSALKSAGISVQTSCETGVCGTCLTSVLDGTPDHRDMVQTDAEKASGDRIAICCSRSRTKRLVLDL